MYRPAEIELKKQCCTQITGLVITAVNSPVNTLVNLNISLAAGTDFTCTLDYGDGNPLVVLTPFDITIPTSVQTHKYLDIGPYTVVIFCKNMVSRSHSWFTRWSSVKIWSGVKYPPSPTLRLHCAHRPFSTPDTHHFLDLSRPAVLYALSNFIKHINNNQYISKSSSDFVIIRLSKKKGIIVFDIKNRSDKDVAN